MSSLAKKDSELTPSANFKNHVLREYSSATGSTEFSPELSRRTQNYFTKIDLIIGDSEARRLNQSQEKREPLEYSWKNINLEKLAMDVFTVASLGLDPLSANHINPILYKNNKTNKFDVGFIRGYKGREIIAKAYGLNPPKNVIVNLVYSKDKLSIFKRDRNNSIESFDFAVVNPFDRGELVGGMFYVEFEDTSLNYVEAVTLAKIEKRKPKYAGVEFWGGEKTTYKNGKPDGKEIVEGWHEEMCRKTLYNMAYGLITIDGQKVNSIYESMIRSESEFNTATETDAAAEFTVMESIKIEQNPAFEAVVVPLGNELGKEVIQEIEMFPETK